VRGQKAKEPNEYNSLTPCLHTSSSHCIKCPG